MSHLTRWAPLSSPLSSRQPVALAIRPQPRYQCQFAQRRMRAPNGARCFSAARTNKQRSDATKRAMREMMKREAQPSIRTAQGARIRDLPNDMGLLPETFVRPTGDRLPGLFFDPKLRWKIEKTWIHSKFQNVVSQIVWKFFMKSWKPRPVLGRRMIPTMGGGLHKDMYLAFAYGDTDTLQRICAEGLLASFRRRISSRAPNELLVWTLHSSSHPSIVSDRSTRIPVPRISSSKSCGIRQVILKIKSRQSLVRCYVKKDKAGNEWLVDNAGKRLPVDENGELAPSARAKEAKDITEYVVLQRRMWLGEEQPWLVWGLVDETTADKMQ